MPMAGVLYFWRMGKEFAIARGKVLRGKVTRIGQLITLANVVEWEKRMEKPYGFLRRRVKDPRKWRLVDVHLLAALIDIPPEKAEELANAEVAFRGLEWER